jgi:hypothetical protein
MLEQLGEAGYPMLKDLIHTIVNTLVIRDE